MKRTLILSIVLCISVVVRAQVSKTLDVTAGGLSAALTTEEKNTINNLTLTGTVDARDFKTMRDEMILLADINITGVSVAAYSDATGTYPANVIPASAFFNSSTYKGKTSLKRIQLPTNITSTGANAFEYCSGLDSISFPSSLTTIGTWSFYECSGLKSVKFSTSLNSIGSFAFAYCKSLTSLSFPASLITIEIDAFKDCTGLSDIFISSSVKTIGDDVFLGCSGNFTVDAGNTNFSGNNGVLYDKNQTKLIQCTISKTGEFTIPSNVLTIGNNAFFDCKNISKVSFPNSVTSIGTSAFENCTGLTSLNLSASITSIGSEAFLNCTSLSALTIPASLQTIGNGAFWSCNIFFTVEAGSLYFSSTDGVLYDKDKTLLIQCPASKTGAFTIPSTVKTIGNGAFKACKNITSINIPVSVITIGTAAFNGCTGLTSVSIPPSVITIGNSAFYSCSGLTAVSLPSSVTTIGEDAFWFCTGLTSIVIPPSVTSVGNAAFAGCSNLSTISIGSSVKSIGWMAFYGCRKITTIHAYPVSPVKLSSSDVFYEVNKTTTALNIPFGTKPAYQAAAVWNEFINMVEMPGIFLSASTFDLGASAQSVNITVLSSAPWTAVSDQTWLTIQPVSGGTGQTTLTFNVTSNNGTNLRTAQITLSATGLESQSIFVKQNGRVQVTAGNLKTMLSGQLGTITNLSLSGTIDARDFKTMRDDMPLLSALDLTDATVVTYTGTEGTYGTTSRTYPANEVPEYAFWNTVTYVSNRTLKNILLPFSVSSTGIGAFGFCMALESVKFPESLLMIKMSAFVSCESLVSAPFPVSLRSIGDRAFEGCTMLNDVHIYSLLESIGDEAFGGTRGPFEVAPDNLYFSSDGGVLYNKSKTTLIRCPSIKTGIFTIYSSVKSIGNCAFEDCNKITQINIPTSVISIGHKAFWYCTGLTSVNIPSSVTSIGGSAFVDCTSLTTISIPSSVTYIGWMAFWDCEKITSIYTYSISPVVLTYTDVFTGINKATTILYVPYGSKSAYQAANVWKDFANIVEMQGINISATNVMVGAAPGSTPAVSVSSDVNWTASAGETWLQVSPASGIGTQTITVSFAENTACTERTTLITFTQTGNPGNTKTVTVVQQANATPVLTVTPASLSVSLAAGTADLTLSNTGCGTMPWSITGSSEWFSVSPAGGSGNQTVKITYDTNSTGATRTGTVSITSPGATGSPKVITITQNSCVAQLNMGTVYGIAGSTVCIPVNASGFSDITGFQFTIDYDKTKLSYVNCTNWGGGTHTSTTALIITPRTDGKVTFVYNGDPVNIVSGKFFDICFTILPGATPGSVPISWSDIPTAREISNSIPVSISTCYTNGYIQIVTGYNLTGTLAYKKSTGNVPLVAVPVELSDAGNNTKGVLPTDATGRYTFEGVQNGTYSLKPDPSGKYLWGGATSMDLTVCKKHIGTAITLDPLNAKACDVNGSGLPSSMDITLIQKRIGTSITSFSVGDWAFDSTSVVISGAHRERNIQVLCYGDVNGSYDPSANLKTASNIFLENSNSIANVSDSEMKVPFIVSAPVEKLSSVTLAFRYPAEFFEVKGVEMTAHNEDLYYTVKDGMIRVVYSTLDPLTLNAGDPLMTIRLGIKENSSREVISTGPLGFSGQGEFGDYDDKVLEGIFLKYSRIESSLMEDVTADNSILIWPNPARDRITIRNAKGADLMVTDILGRKLLEKHCITDPVEIDLSRFVTGTYLVTLNRNNDLIYKKISVLK